MNNKILIFAAVAASLVSCLGESHMEFVVPSEATFEVAQTILGSDSLYFETVPGWDYLGFSNVVDTVKTVAGSDSIIFKGGFAISCLRGADSLKVVENPVNPFRVTGVNERNGYLVWRYTDDMPEHDVFFTATNYGKSTIGSCLVNNTEAVRRAILSEGGFVAGNYLELKATGYLANGTKTGEATIDLAEFAKKDSVVTTWTTFDLSALAQIDFIDFELSTNRPDLPLDSFCMDDFISSTYIRY